MVKRLRDVHLERRWANRRAKITTTKNIKKEMHPVVSQGAVNNFVLGSRLFWIEVLLYGSIYTSSSDI